MARKPKRQASRASSSHARSPLSGKASARRPSKTKSAPKPAITIVGPGRLGSALSVALHRAGYRLEEIVARDVKKARALAKAVGARAVSSDEAKFGADVVWLAVGDSEIRRCATALANGRDWAGKVVFHSSGALTSEELSPLSELGAAVASVHPLMTFVGSTPPSLKDVLFAVEGDARAVKTAEQIVRRLGGAVLRIDPKSKPAYHTWAAFGSPMLIALLAAAEQIALAAGLHPVQARRAIAPLVRQTVDNYVKHGAAAAFTGPLVRGDVATIRKHLEVVSNEVLRDTPAVHEAYLALAKAALELLPVGNAEEIRKLLKTSEIG